MLLNLVSINIEVFYSLIILCNWCSMEFNCKDIYETTSYIVMVLLTISKCCINANEYMTESDDNCIDQVNFL